MLIILVFISFAETETLPQNMLIREYAREEKHVLLLLKVKISNLLRSFCLDQALFFPDTGIEIYGADKAGGEGGQHASQENPREPHAQHRGKQPRQWDPHHQTVYGAAQEGQHAEAHTIGHGLKSIQEAVGNVGEGHKAQILDAYGNDFRFAVEDGNDVWGQ